MRILSAGTLSTLPVPPRWGPSAPVGSDCPYGYQDDGSLNPHSGNAPLRLLLIVNPSASAVSPRTRVVVNGILAARHDVRTVLTTRRHHAAALARRGAREKADAVVVLGGDGTLNEAANGLAGSDTALAPLPGGSTNVFARTLGLPDDPIDAAEATLQALEGGSIRRIGLGAVNWRYFLFHVGLGFDAAVVERVELRSDFKPALNHALFVWETLWTWLRHFDRASPYFRIELPGGRCVENGYFAVFMNTDPYTYLGGRPFSLAPEATLASPLVMLSVRRPSAWNLIRLAYQSLRHSEGLIGSPLVHHATDVLEARVVGHRRVPVQVDGDFAGLYDELRLRYQPEVLRVVLPVLPAA